MTDKSQRRSYAVWPLRVRTWLCVGAMLFLLNVVYNSTWATPTTYAASGDWAGYMMGNARTGFNGNEHTINQTTVRRLKLHWAQTSPQGISSQAIIARGRVFWGSWDGMEHGTPINGARGWITALGKTTAPGCVPTSVGIASTATIATTSIKGVATAVDYVGGGNGYFYALNADSGAVLWRTLLGAPPSRFLWSSPAVYNGNVYEGVASFGDCPLIQGRMVQMDAVTGVIKHIFKIVPDGCVGGGVWTSPAIDEASGTVYFATGNEGSCSTSESLTDALVALKASDLSLVSSWQIPQAEQIRDGDFGATPTLFSASVRGTRRNMIGLINKNGIYYAFNRAAIGAGPLWRSAIAQPGDCPECGPSSVSPSAWDGNTLYVAGGSRVIGGENCHGSVNALRPDTGAILWAHCLRAGSVLGPVTAIPGLVIVAQGTDFNIINSSTGKMFYYFHEGRANSLFVGGVSISGGVLYVGNLDGYLYAFGL